MSQKFEIFPQALTVLPNDRVRFTARGTPPPPMWVSVVSGKVLSDYSLQLNPSSDSHVYGIGAHRLYAGIGIIEWTIDDNSRPTSTGSLNYKAYIQGTPTLYQYLVKIEPAAIKIYDETASLLQNTAYSVVSGDVFRLELVSGFRLYKNGVLLHSRVNLGTAVIYPMAFDVDLIKPVAGTIATIKRPILYGEGWKLYPNVTFTAPSHGSISSVGPGISTDYSGGTIPGTYQLIGQINAAADPDNLQRAIATITIPPLQILGDTEVTLQPIQKVRFKTNYDLAQSELVGWTVVSGGGSFTEGEYTSQSSPGTSVVKATAAVNNTIAQITITVPAIIYSPVKAVVVNETIVFGANFIGGTINWTASGGSPTSGSGSIFAWTSPLLTPGGTYKITATNGGLTATIELDVVDYFEFKPSGPIETDGRKTVLVSQSENRKRDTRVKDPDGLSFEAGELQFRNRDATEFLVAYQFWNDHYPAKKFLITKKYVGTTYRYVVYFDSDFRWSVNSDCSIDYSFRVVEA